jgi:hypothetical protein
MFVAVGFRYRSNTLWSARTRVVVLASFVALASCGHPSRGNDAGTDASVLYDGAPSIALDPPRAPAPPSEAALPNLMPCPSGWSPRFLSGATASSRTATVCEPWANTSSCAAVEMQAPGESSCARIGHACPATEWPTDLPATNVRYVRASTSAAGGGTGTREDPYLRISDALTSAGPGTTIALGRGTFRERIVLGADVSVVGACVEGTTVLAPSADDLEAIVEIDTPHASLSDLTISGARPAFVVMQGAGASISAIRVDGVVNFGILSIGALDVDRVIVRNVHRETNADRAGYGVYALNAGRANLRHVLIEHHQTTGLVAYGGQISVADSIVRDADGLDDGASAGHGAFIESGGSAVIVRSVIERQREDAIRVRDPGSSLILDASVIRGTSGIMADPHYGEGITVALGATATITRTLIEDTRSSDLFLASDSAISTVVISDSVLRGRPSIDELDLVAGIETSTHARIRVERVLFDGNYSAGLYMPYPDVGIDLEDVTVRDTKPRPNFPDPATEGYGLWLARGAQAIARRLDIEHSTTLGIFVADRASLSASDVIVRDVDLFRGSYGYGLAAEYGATLSLTRAAFERNRGIGLELLDPDTTAALADITISAMVAEGPGAALAIISASVSVDRAALEAATFAGVIVEEQAHVRLTDVAILDTASSTTGTAGLGISCFSGAALTIQRASLQRNLEVGLRAVGMGTIVRGSNVHIANTREPTCAKTSCRDLAGSGTGVATSSAGRVTLDRFVIEGSALVGVDVSGSGEIDLAHGIVEHNPVGANIDGAATFDVARLSNDVVYLDNGENLEATSLPIPAPSIPLIQRP